MDESDRHSVEQKEAQHKSMYVNSDTSTSNQSMGTGVGYLGLLLGKGKREYSVVVPYANRA